MKDLEFTEQTVSSQDASGLFRDLLHGVSYKSDRYVVEKDEVPLAEMVPFALYAQWKRRRNGFFGQLREVADRDDLSEIEATRLTDGAKRAIRSHP